MPPRESERRSKPSKRSRRAQGLPSSSEDSGNDGSESEATPPSVQSIESTATSNPAELMGRRERFEMRYKTATRSNSDVLSE
jgi:hypothetical protein